MIPNDYPIGIIGDGDVTTAKSVRHYSPGHVRNVLDLADWCLGTGAKIEPLRALWIAPGSDIAELAKSPEFWQVDTPGWKCFTTGPQGAPAPDVASIRRTDTGKWEREVTIYAGLDSRWMLGIDETAPHSAILSTIATYERLIGQTRLSPASTALALLDRVNGHSERAGWMDPLSRDALDKIPWPQNRAPGHVNHDVEWGDYVHVFDKRSAYMASAQCKLGRGDPDWYRDVDAAKFDECLRVETPGLWCISLGPGHNQDYAHLPNPFNTHGDMPDHDWYYTPQLKLAQAMGYNLIVHEAYLWAHAHPVLTTWVQKLWQARQATRGQPVEDMIKASFTQSLGILARRPGEGEKAQWYHRPDWAGTLTAQHYMRQVKKIMQIDAALGGNRYMAVSTDSFAVTSNDPDPVRAMPIGWAGIDGMMGQYRHVATYGRQAAQELLHLARDGASAGKLFKLMNKWDDEANEDGEDDHS